MSDKLHVCDFCKFQDPSNARPGPNQFQEFHWPGIVVIYRLCNDHLALIQALHPLFGCPYDPRTGKRTLTA